MLKDNIKKFREQAGLSQRDLARILHVSQTAISSWETGRTEPNMGAIEDLCEALDCTKSELLDYSERSMLSSKESVCKVRINSNNQIIITYLPYITATDLKFIQMFKRADAETKEIVERLLLLQETNAYRRRHVWSEQKGFVKNEAKDQSPLIGPEGILFNSDEISEADQDSQRREN